MIRGMATSETTSIAALRHRVFNTPWPLDEEVTRIAAAEPSHAFLANPSGQLAYRYLTWFVKIFAEQHFQRPFAEISVLDWGCGKGHVSKFVRDLGPAVLESCDIEADENDSAFGQPTPILDQFSIAVTPLIHPYELPYPNSSFDIVLSFGVLEHVPDDRASLGEIERVLTPGGLFFCFFLPTTLSWTQKVAHMRGNNYHDRLYGEREVNGMLRDAGFELLDLWYRQVFPKNGVHYPAFRTFEKLDQALTERTPLRVFATNLEFVATKAR